MSTDEIRQRLHEYIDVAENKKLEAIYTLLENDIEPDYELSDEQKAELDRRLEDYKNGRGKTYTWEESLAHINEELLKYKSAE